LNQQTESTWKYHDLTKHSYWSVRTQAHYLDWDNRPGQFKIYPGIEPQKLSTEITQTGAAALAAIAATNIDQGRNTPTLDQLAAILFYSAGVTKKKTFPGGEIYFRAAACAGALYPVETYIVCGDMEGLRAGVYHFNAGDFSLRRLRTGDHRGAIVAASGSEESIAHAPVILVHSAITWRSAWKYRDRAYRYHFWDAGMIAANALAAAASHRLHAKIVMGFVEEDINRLIDIDGERELALSLMALGRDAEIKTSPTPERLNLETIPLSAFEVDYPSIREMHSASSLATADEVARWRSGQFTGDEPDATGSTVPLQTPDALAADSIEDVIVRRGSTRRFARKAISFEQLSVILDRATRGVEFDFASDHLNDIYLIVNAVTGLDQGAYFYRRKSRALELLRRGDFRERAAYLTLEQGLGGDASATLFFMADLNRLLPCLGNRGYRLAQMEAAITCGKMYLAAYAMRRGATGLTFYDDEVTEFFSPHSEGKNCMIVLSLGVAGKRPVF
jgi:SagB-type dehydrogenase family enzyme